MDREKIAMYEGNNMIGYAMITKIFNSTLRRDKEDFQTDNDKIQ